MRLEINFVATNGASPENILVVKYLNAPDLGFTLQMATLHYNQYSGGEAPWNGYSTLVDVYNAFDAADQRRQIFLIGNQVNQITGLPVTDRAGNPLMFDPVIIDDANAKENMGARIMKYPVDPNHLDRANGNDYALYRLAEIYLIKAEAQNELGNGPAAIALINIVRARVFSPPKPLAAGLTQQQIRDAILSERLFELTGESSVVRISFVWGSTRGRGSSSSPRVRRSFIVSCCPSHSRSWELTRNSCRTRGTSSSRSYA